MTFSLRNKHRPWNIRFDEKIVEYKDPNIPIGHDENMVLEEVEKAIKLYEENKDLDTSTGNMEVSEESEEPMVLI